MGENTTIEWCDHTFNPWRGCQKVASGCANCYADAQSKRNTGTLGVWGPNGTRVVAAESQWKAVEKWNRDWLRQREAYSEQAAEWDMPAPPSAPRPPSIFCGSMCDVFEDWPNIMRGSGGGYLHHANKWQRGDGRKYVEINGIAIGQSRVTMSDVRTRLFNLIDATRLTWLLLTKRPENIRRFWPTVDKDSADLSTLLANHMRAVNARIAAGGAQYDPASEHVAYASERDNMPCRDNVWLGTSIACRADLENAEDLAKCRELCAGTFWSIEPLIEDLGQIFPTCRYCEDGCQDPETGLVECEHCDCTGLDLSNAPDQVIIGGESGPHARPCRPEWIRSIARQCEAAGALCFVKQIGSNPVGLRFSIDDNGRPFCIENDSFRGGAKPLDKKGGDPAEWPEYLRKYRSLAWKGGA